MNNEIEVKFYPVNKDEILVKLRELGATNVQGETLMRRAIYDHRANPGINCTYARIRDEGNKITASLKVNAEQGGNIYDQKEAQIKVDSFENAREIFKGLGLKETNYQENKRDTWNYLNSEIVIDTWPALETYIEIEGPNEDELEKITLDLGLDWNDRVFVSTDELYAKKYGITKEEALKEISIITFSDIPESFRSKL